MVAVMDLPSLSKATTLQFTSDVGRGHPSTLLFTNEVSSFPPPPPPSDIQPEYPFDLQSIPPQPQPQPPHPDQTGWIHPPPPQKPPMPGLPVSYDPPYPTIGTPPPFIPQQSEPQPEPQPAPHARIPGTVIFESDPAPPLQSSNIAVPPLPTPDIVKPPPANQGGDAGESGAPVISAAASVITGEIPGSESVHSPEVFQKGWKNIDLSLSTQSQILIAVFMVFFFGCSLMRCCGRRRKRAYDDEYLEGVARGGSTAGGAAAASSSAAQSDVDWSDHTEEEEDDEEEEEAPHVQVHNGGGVRGLFGGLGRRREHVNSHSSRSLDAGRGDKNVKILMEVAPDREDDEDEERYDEDEDADTDEETRAIMREFKDSDEE